MVNNKLRENRVIRTIGLNCLVLIGVISVMYLFFAILTPILRGGASFVQMDRIMSARNCAYFIGFLGLGVTFVIATGGIVLLMAVTIDMAKRNKSMAA